MSARIHTLALAAGSRRRARVGRRAFTLFQFGFLLVAALVAGGVLSFGAGTAGAASGTAGPIAITVTPTSGVSDGQAISIHAEAPAGTVIYELRAHLCLPNANVNNTFDFGFQGKKCTNAAVGAGDVEQVASFGQGVSTADLDTFKVGVGTVHWVDELGYDQIIDCGPGKQCDVVVQVQITNGTVFFTVPLCYGAACAPDGAPATTAPPTTAAPAPPAAAASASGTGTGSAGAGANPTTAAGSAAAPKAGAASGAAKAGHGDVGTKSAGAQGKGDGSTALAEATPASATTTASDTGLSLTARLFIAAIAGALGAARIIAVLSKARRNSTTRLGTA